MRKLLLLLVLGLGLASCQKDYYLDELNETKEQVEILRAELQTQIDTNNIQAQFLGQANDEIAELNVLIEGYLNNLDAQGQFISEQTQRIFELENLINELQSEIEALSSEVETLSLYETENLATIRELTEQITELENQEAEVIIEYVTTVLTEIEYVEVVEYVTQIVEVSATIQNIQEFADRLEFTFTNGEVFIYELPAQELETGTCYTLTLQNPNFNLWRADYIGSDGVAGIATHVGTEEEAIAHFNEQAEIHNWKCN